MSENRTQVAVIGGGPGGYPAAFQAADLGLEVTLVDEGATPGGVCLYRGCIPSKALLHAAHVMHAARDAATMGIDVGGVMLDVDRLRSWKQGVVDRLTGGLAQLCKARKIRFVQGRATFANDHALTIALADGGEETLSFDHAILATGSRPVRIPGTPESDRILDSTGALDLKDVPNRLLVVGGGYIGLELGQAYAGLGSRVTVVEMLPSLMAGCDKDLARVLLGRLKKEFDAIHTETRVKGMREEGDEVEVVLEGKDGAERTETYDRVLVSIGRRPNLENLGLENTGVTIGEDRFVVVDEQRRTQAPSIFAIGDIAGNPMLAHKATYEGKIAAEVIAGKKVACDWRAMPAVVFTDPEIAWCGLTEDEAQAVGRDVKVGKFPWAASGRATTLGRSDGMTKVIADAESGRVLGVGVAGPGAGELIAEGVLAVEMGGVAEDLALSIHPHPTLSETIMEAAEAVMGSSTHVAGRR